MVKLRRLEDAEHEAGHAVVAEFLGLRVHSVELSPTSHPNDWGHAIVDVPGRGRRLHDALVDAAGPAAEILAGRGPRGRTKILPRWRSDFASIRKAGFSAKEREVLVHCAQAMLLGPCAVAWRRVADALCMQDLTGAQVRSAFRGPIDLD